MVGNNSMTICPALMQEIVQHYLDTVLLKEGQLVKVTGVKGPTGGSYTDSSFTVMLEPVKG